MCRFFPDKRVFVSVALAACCALSPGRVFADAPASAILPQHPAGTLSWQDAPLLKDAEGELWGAIDAPEEAAWWRWIAPEDGKIDLETDGSAFDTELCSFQKPKGSDELEPLSCNDNRGPFVMVSHETLLARSGNEYFFRLAGTRYDHGAYRLAWRFRPLELVANDTPEMAPFLEGDAGQVEASVAPGGDVWWRWTAPSDGRLKISTAGTEFGPDISVLAANADSSPGDYKAGNQGATRVYLDTRLDCLVREGEELFFYLRRSTIDGWESKRGVVAWKLQRLQLRGNNAAQTAARIEGNAGLLETAEPAQEAWWRWTAPEDGYLAAEVEYSFQEARLHRAPETPQGKPALIAKGGMQALSKVQGGRDYLIQTRLTGKNANGEATRGAWAFVPRRVNPASISGPAAMEGAEGYFRDALISLDRPAWWRWEAPADGRIRFWPHLAGSSGWSDILMAAVYDENGEMLGFKVKDYDDLNIDLSISAGKVYFIRADLLALDPQTREMNLSWSPAPAEEEK